MKPVDGIGPVAVPASVKPKAPVPGFREMVDGKVTFSRHAEQRLKERHIDLSPSDLSLLHEAMGQARSAGSKQAAIVMEPGIFIVAPNSNTVITTVAQNSGKPMQLISHVDALVLVGRTSSEGASSPRATDGGQPAPVHWSLIDNQNP